MTSELLLLLEAEQQLLPSTPQTSQIPETEHTYPSSTSQAVPCCHARVFSVHLQPQDTFSRANLLEYSELSMGELYI